MLNVLGINNMSTVVLKETYLLQLNKTKKKKNLTQLQFKLAKMLTIKILFELKDWFLWAPAGCCSTSKFKLFRKKNKILDWAQRTDIFITYAT